MAFLELTNVGKSFDGRPVLHDINLTIEAGSFVSLLGLSGCGKTTLLRIIAGLEQPDTGMVRLAGRDITALAAPERHLGIVFQNYALFPHLNVFENVAFGLKIKRDSPAQVREKVTRILEKVNLEGKALQSVARLSGGEQQRVALARAIVTEPQVLLLDEPLSNLDHSLRLQARNELKRLQHELGITSIYVTHDQTEALALSDRIAVMHGGRVVQAGTPRQVYYQPTNAFTAGFVGHCNLFCPGQAAALLNCSIASTAQLAVLPEHLQLSPATSPTGVVVQDVLFGGTLTEYVLATNAGWLKAQLPTSAANGFAPGDAVALTVAPAHCRELTA